MNGNRKHILVVEDEQHLSVLIKHNLEAEGYRVTTAADGASALQVAESVGDVDLVILDLMLPRMSGYAVCERLRADGLDIPIMILSARSMSDDRTRGFDVGADQYLSKPFELKELLARVKNLLAMHERRKEIHLRPKDLKEFSFADARINFETFEVTVGGRVEQLTKMEADLLKYFVTHEGRVIPREELLTNIWKVPGYLNTRAPDQFLRRLRKIFEVDPAKPRHFLTLRDVGYRFLANPEIGSERESEAKPTGDESTP